MGNIVYIATSLDGFIADRDDKLDWLQSVPNPDNSDLGFGDFLNSIDGVVMGRHTFETVLFFVISMDVEWPYSKPVFVLSRSLESVPEKVIDKVEIVQGCPWEISKMLNDRGYSMLYIDGGKTIQGFLAEDKIDEMIITRLPILLGGGIPLFGSLPEDLIFNHISTKVLLNEMVVSHYIRDR